MFSHRANFLFEELRAQAGDPNMPDNAFNPYVRQSMVLDFDQFIESLAKYPRKFSEHEHDLNSVVAVVDKAVLTQLLAEQNILISDQNFDSAIQSGSDGENIFADAEAHLEDPQAWISKIRQYLQLKPKDISLRDLQTDLGMPLVEVWLGLLLGHFKYPLNIQGLRVIQGSRSNQRN